MQEKWNFKPLLILFIIEIIINLLQFSLPNPKVEVLDDGSTTVEISRQVVKKNVASEFNDSD